MSRRKSVVVCRLVVRPRSGTAGAAGHDDAEAAAACRNGFIAQAGWEAAGVAAVGTLAAVCSRAS